MAKEKVTLTLDVETLAGLREIVGRGSLSAAVDSAVRTYVGKQRHLLAIDAWLAELDEEHGPVPTQTMRWAAEIVETWELSGGDARGAADAAAG